MNPSRTDVAFFLGAGFTKASTGVAPVGQELSDRILTRCTTDSRSASSTADVQDLLKTYFGVRLESKTRKYPRLEDVLSLLDFAVLGKRNLGLFLAYDDAKAIRSQIQRALVTEFDDALRTNVNDDCRDFFEKLQLLHRARIVPAIISTNYDLVADNMLMRYLESCNYGFAARRVLGSTDLQRDDLRRGGVRGEIEKRWHFGSASGSANSGCLHIKLHGSLNWLYCPRCDEVDITVGEKGAAFAVDPGLSCGNQNCTAYYEPLIVDPTMYKLYDNRLLRESRDLAERVLNRARVIVFIGYSLPEADYELRCLLVRAVANNYGAERQRLLVIDDAIANKKRAQDTNLIKAVGRRYKSLFGGKIRFLPIGLHGLLERFDELIVCQFETSSR
jgi:hypothetical protein